MTGLLLLLTTLANESKPVDRLDEFFREFSEKRNGIETLHARFDQKNKTGEDVLTVHGEIVYVKPRRILFRYDDPEIVHLVDGSRMHEYDAELGQVLIYDLEDDPHTEALFLGFDDDTTRLREAYEVEFFEPREKGAKGILLIPKPDESGGSYFERARLFLRPGDYLPYRVEVVNDPESEVTIEVKKIVVNGKLDPAETRIALPEGTKIIENDKLVETVGHGGKCIPAETFRQSPEQAPPP